MTVIGMLLLLSTSVSAAATIHWGYGGSENPTQWAKLSNDFALCELGRDQSPINIQDAVDGSPAKITFNYNPSPLEVVNNGHTIQVNYAPGSTVNINGDKYSLLQFHFHTPSEHNINEKAAAMELHLVHRNELGQLAVVGAMINKGKENSLIEDVWKNIPAVGETNTVSDRLVNATDLLPKSKAYYSYEGSLTTPPCSEGVKWNLFVEPLTLSEAQIDAFEKMYQVDARPLQPINGRVVQLHR
ncbi:MAG: carbonate dehydratase [Pseudanabaena frigida]|uniref:carbonic anhydrase n=1 Tax=Pseudanabaena frigida TaxID=945775 RepID=A0A2W4W8C0_9CYAN|nr:MAG: carbonate dehydratase [Pseudanabaena frigida]